LSSFASFTGYTVAFSSPQLRTANKCGRFRFVKVAIDRCHTADCRESNLGHVSIWNTLKAYSGEKPPTHSNTCLLQVNGPQTKYFGSMTFMEMNNTGSILKSRWSILIVLFFARTGLGFQFQALGSVSEQLIDEFAINYRQLGTLIGMFTLAGVFLSIPVGMALKLTTERVLSSTGLLFLACGGFVAAASNSYDFVAIGRLLCGVGFVLSTVYLTKMITDWFVGKELATALGILMMSWPLGIALAQVTQPLIAESFGWSSAFIVSGIYCLFGCIAISVMYRPPTSKGAAQSSVINRLSSVELKLTLIAALVWAAFNAGYIVYLSFAQTMLLNNGLPTLHAAAIASLPSWIMIFATIVAGQLADRTGKHDIILYTGMLAAAIAMVLVTVSGAALAAVLIFGLIGAAPAGVIMSLTAESMPAGARAFGMGLFFTVYFILVTPAPVIAGYLYDKTGKASAPLFFAALLFLVAALSNVCFRKVQSNSGKL